jgi:L-ascorbate metabolism protein UlaG (beta-lactamase superfamily)
MWLVAEGLEKLNPMNPGGAGDRGGFAVTIVRANHCSGEIADGAPIGLGNPIGVMVQSKRDPMIDHMGDTDVFVTIWFVAEIHRLEVARVPDRARHKGAVTPERQVD